MHTQQPDISTPDYLIAANAAVRAIPPAFPLDGTVAVNPFLGQSSERMPRAAARLARVAGVPLTAKRQDLTSKIATGEISDDDLTAALEACPSAQKPADLARLKAASAVDVATPQALPTVANLAAAVTGTDWPGVIADSFGLWAAGHFDRGQAFWTPAPGIGALAAWQAWATHDLTPEIAGLKGFCAHVAKAPDTANRAIQRAASAIGLGPQSAQTAFHRLLIDLGGWSQHARWILWQAELQGDTDATLTDLLAIRLIWEEALIAHVPDVADAWRATVAAHAAPLIPNVDQIIDTILQDAAERAFQRQLLARLASPGPAQARPALQAAFCIDVRSEVFRRILEAQDQQIETIGFAGFFGLPLAHKVQGTDQANAYLPALLSPSMTTASHVDLATEERFRINSRATRAWGRFRQAAVSSFAFVEAAGPVYGWKLLQDNLGIGRKNQALDPMPQVVGGLSANQKTDIAAAILRAMSMTRVHARLVLLVGHGAKMTNNPHQSAYHCGACCGQTGEVSARVLAALLNDAQTRNGLRDHGIALPDDTLFMAGLHDTVTDQITLYNDGAKTSHHADIAQAQAWLAAASAEARAERSARFPLATPQNIAARSANWAEPRPEWGLAGCAAFIAAPRAVTAGADLQGRTFLHDYDWRSDMDYATLELILTAPVVVASWISLQYYGSAIAPAVFGGGNKLIHNVVGGIGVLEGNSGILRTGLPWQTIHDGDRLMHDPLRLSVMIAAPRDAITDVLSRHSAVRDLFDNGWLHLFALRDGKATARYRPGLQWTDIPHQPARAA